MIDLETVKNSNDWSSFKTIDQYNNNEVDGFLCHHGGDDYGMLFITSVNGQSALSVVTATPKLHYPFSKDGNWNFPKAAKLLRFVKEDGTNIFCFRYKDATGKHIVSYKTRLVPFLQNSKFGPFKEMVDEIIVGGEGGLQIIDHKPKSNFEAKTPSIPDQRNF